MPQFHSLGVKVFGVSKDSLASHEKFITAKGLTTPLLSDPETTTLAAYGAYGLKKLYGKESMGVIRSTVLIGPDARIAMAWPKAPSTGHAVKVLEAAARLAG